jgi:hypothetical protein
MSIGAVNLMGWNRIQVSAGGIFWLSLTVAEVCGITHLGALPLILLLALYVITPLTLPLIIRQPSSTMLRLALLLHPVAAAIGGVSFFLTPGPLAGTFAYTWLLFTLFLALVGAQQLRRPKRPSLADFCLSVALIYLPIGGAWLVLARLGLRPLGFSPTTVLLTTAHFHYITLAALVMTGLVGQVLGESPNVRLQQLYRLAALCILICPLLVALGITVTQLTGIYILESCAALLLAINLILLALLTLRFLVPTATPVFARGLLAVSSLAVFFTMLFATAYVLGVLTSAWVITVTEMIAVHGWTNALAFGLCGLLGWRLRFEDF